MGKEIIKNLKDSTPSGIYLRKESSEGIRHSRDGLKTMNLIRNKVVFPGKEW